MAFPPCHPPFCNLSSAYCLLRVAVSQGQCQSKKLRADLLRQGSKLGGLFAGGDCQQVPKSVHVKVSVRKEASVAVEDFLGFGNLAGFEIESSECGVTVFPLWHQVERVLKVGFSLGVIPLDDGEHA